MVNADDVSSVTSSPRRSADKRSAASSSSSSSSSSLAAAVMSAGMLDSDLATPSAVNLEWPHMFSEQGGVDTLDAMALAIEHLSAPSDILDEIERYTSVFNDPRTLEMGLASGEDAGVLDGAAGHMDIGGGDTDYYPALHSWEGINDMFSSADLPWPPRSFP
jgi:hypothetical protein